MIDAGTLLQSIASREKRQAILHNCQLDTLAKLQRGFASWDVRFYPRGPMLAQECADELRRRETEGGA